MQYKANYKATFNVQFTRKLVPYVSGIWTVHKTTVLLCHLGTKGYLLVLFGHYCAVCRCVDNLYVEQLSGKP